MACADDDDADATATADVNDHLLHVFAYGSLMYEPELAPEILHRRPAWLPGHRRAMNKTSFARGLAPGEGRRWPHVEPPPQFVTPDRQLSLALGTAKAPGAALHGLIVIYPAAVAARLLARLDLREGHRDGAPLTTQHYVRTTVELVTVDGAVEALTYLSNPAGPAHRPDLSVAEQARILVAATPREDGGKARGLDYVTRSRETAGRFGLPTPELDAVIDAAERVIAQA